MKGNVLYVCVLFWEEQSPSTVHGVKKNPTSDHDHVGYRQSWMFHTFQECFIYILLNPHSSNWFDSFGFPVWFPAFPSMPFYGPKRRGMNLFLLALILCATGENYNHSTEISQLRKKWETCFIQTTTCLLVALHSGPFPAPVGVKKKKHCVFFSDGLLPVVLNVGTKWWL